MSKRIQISDKFTFGKLIRFAVPSMIMVIFTSLYGIVDGLFVSNFAGDDAFTAINLFLPIFYILGSVGFMLGSGGCALIAKLLGENNADGARRNFGGLVIITATAGAVFTAAMIPCMNKIAVALGAKGAVTDHCTVYGTIMLGGLVPFMMQNFFQYFFAVADRPKLGLAITVAAGMTNILGDFLLIYVAKMGIKGAAIATVVGECVGGIIPLVYFFVKTGKTLYFGKPTFAPRTIGKTCANGSSEMITNLSVSAVSVIYNFQLLKYVGNSGVIAYGVIMYVSFIFVGCFLGFSVGTAPIVGYNYGAKNTDELKSVFKKSILFYAIAAIAMTSIAELLAKPLAMIFVSHDARLLEFTTNAIRIFSVSFVISGFNIYASAFFTALNNGVISALISVSRTLLFQIGAVFLMPLIFGINGIWSATAFAELFTLIISVICTLTLRKKYGYL
ncbi:MAG: MATE family efflux transporter [Clostridiales bacterium]|nr:MATE family efflux transporter [Clostridiales bacterium]